MERKSFHKQQTAYKSDTSHCTTRSSYLIENLLYWIRPTQPLLNTNITTF